MNNIITIYPERVLLTSDAQVFMVVWTNSQVTFFRTGSGEFQNTAHGRKMDSPAVKRHNAVRQYYNLLRTEKSHPFLTEGRIDLLAMPIFNYLNYNKSSKWKL